jgi:hypothetical protein
MSDETIELAHMILDVLNAQQQYFKSRSKEDLIASKQLERILRQHAEQIVRSSKK